MLIKVFPNIWLFICKFHFHQSWCNYQTCTIKGFTTLHQQVQACLRQLELSQVKSMDYTSTIQAIAAEYTVVAADVKPVDVDIASSVIKHLDYLENYWLLHLAFRLVTYWVRNQILAKHMLGDESG